jgi:hypothetical protein
MSFNYDQCGFFFNYLSNLWRRHKKKRLIDLCLHCSKRFSFIIIPSISSWNWCRTGRSVENNSKMNIVFFCLTNSFCNSHLRSVYLIFHTILSLVFTTLYNYFLCRYNLRVSKNMYSVIKTSSSILNVKPGMCIYDLFLQMWQALAQKLYIALLFDRQGFLFT